MDDKKDWMIVPAAAGQRAVVMGTFRDDGGRPETTKDVLEWEHFVVAWKVHQGEPMWAEPVLPVMMQAGEAVYVVEPDGTLTLGDGPAPSWEDARKRTLKQGQQAWDATRKPG